MNHEKIKDPTADIAVGRVYKEWLKKQRKRRKGKDAKSQAAKSKKPEYDKA